MQTVSKSTQEPLSVNMKSAIGLLEIFVIAVVAAFVVTIIQGTTEIRLIALIAVSPQILFSALFIYYCRRKKLWSFAGASIFGAIGLLLRVIVSAQPSLEIGGGLPV